MNEAPLIGTSSERVASIDALRGFDMFWIIDVGGHEKWAFFFIVIGTNPITIYFLQVFVDFRRISSFFLAGVAQHAGRIGPLILACGVLTVKWLFLRFLYRHRIFFKV